MKNLVDKLVLGTVQFGLDYGINNFNGKPKREDSLAMLECAYNNGIRIFDTANAYGDAEEILGEFIKKNNLSDKIQIITKLRPNIIDEKVVDVYQAILENLNESLKRLGRKYVDGYLFHSPAYVRDKRLVSCLRRLKTEGLVKKIGVSIYEEDDAIYAAQLDEIDYIQIPYSIFDQRLNKTNFFEIAKKNKKKIFARSAFLQGLLFMEHEKIPENLWGVKKHLKEFQDIIDKHKITRQQAALLFSYKNEHIDFVVFGVDNLEQLSEDINTIKQKIDFNRCFKDLSNRFVNIEKSIIFPSLWKK